MSAFDFNPADAVAGLMVFPKADEPYQIEIGEPKAFYRKGKDGKDDNFGIMFRSKIAEGTFKGKTIIINCYMHTEESRGFSKQYQMAALGYDTKIQGDEEKFNEATRGWDWKANPDDGSCGDGWHKMSKQIILADLDTKINAATNEPQQQTKSVKPLVHAA